MARLAIGHPTTHGPPLGRRDTDTPFNTAPQLRAQLVQLQNTLSLLMNKPAFLLQPLGSAHRQKATQKKRVTTIHRHFHKQLLESLTTSPVDSAVPFSQAASHTGPHLMQPSTKADEAADRCVRVAVARRLMLPHPAGANPADLVRTCPNKSAAGQICTKQVDGTAAPLLRLSVRRRCRLQACCSGQMPSRCDTLTQWHQGADRTGGASPHSYRERSAGARAHGPFFLTSTVPPRTWMSPHCASFFQQPGALCCSQHPPMSPPDPCSFTSPCVSSGSTRIIFLLSPGTSL